MWRESISSSRGSRSAEDHLHPDREEDDHRRQQHDLECEDQVLACEHDRIHRARTTANISTSAGSSSSRRSTSAQTIASLPGRAGATNGADRPVRRRVPARRCRARWQTPRAPRRPRPAGPRAGGVGGEDHRLDQEDHARREARTRSWRARPARLPGGRPAGRLHQVGMCGTAHLAPHHPHVRAAHADDLDRTTRRARAAAGEHQQRGAERGQGLTRSRSRPTRNRLS